MRPPSLRTLRPLPRRIPPLRRVPLVHRTPRVTRPATSHALAATPGATYAERVANLFAALEARIGQTEVHGDTGSDDGPPEPVTTDHDSDQAAARDENRRWRNLP